MIKKFVILILTILGFLIGYNMSKVINKMILWKEKKKNKTYTISRPEYPKDKWINGLVISLGIFLAFYYLEIYEAVLASIICISAVFGVRMDERIRIIPNELVLFIMIVGIVHQLLTNGIRGLGSGFLALIITGAIFFLSAFVTRFFSGSIGVGAGDIKLAMALSIIMGLENMSIFLIGIVLFLVVYLLIGLFTKTIAIGSSFPMCIQIMGGSIIAIYKPIIMEIIRFFN